MILIRSYSVFGMAVVVGNEVANKLVKYMRKRGWNFKENLGKFVLMERRNYVIVLLPIEGKKRVFVNERAIKRALSNRNRLRREGVKVDAVVAARIGRKWRFVLLTKVKKIKLESKSLSNWSP